MNTPSPWLLLAALASCVTPSHAPPPTLPGSATVSLKRWALASPQPRRLIPLLETELAVHDSDPSGTKPAIFCLHAIGHGGSDFAAFEAAFADSYRIITIDWPGQGASPPDVQPADAQRYTALFSALVERLEVRSLIILGNSIGGSVAIRYAAAQPDRVRALLLANSAGLDRNPGGFLPGLFISRIARKMRQGAAGDPDFADWFRDYYRAILSAPAAATQRAAIVASGYEVAAVLAQAWESFGRKDSDVRALAAKLPMPVFVGWAAHDKLIRWRRNRTAVERIPRVQWRLFDAGHAAFLETPGPFNEAVASFLRRLDPVEN
ncbi:MAG: hypothetical protein JWN48_1515 [Myxococcaceae bacterium]|nr:hypothetical protein [Myxococcaceae bacterium]